MSTDPIRVHSQYLTDPNDPDGPCLVEIRAWPLPQVVGIALARFLDDEAKRYLLEKYPGASTETVWEAK